MDPMLACALPLATVRDRVLDAAEALVSSVGGANLTLDAVAHKAGISKGGLLYHYPNKDSLLLAMIDRHVDRLDRRCALMQRDLPGELASSDLKAWILGNLSPGPVHDATGAALFAAAACNPALLDGIRRRYAERVAQLTSLTDDFPLAAVIVLAVDGLMLGEALGMTPFTSEQRAQVVQQLLRLVEQAFGARSVPERTES